MIQNRTLSVGIISSVGSRYLYAYSFWNSLMCAVVFGKFYSLTRGTVFLNQLSFIMHITFFLYLYFTYCFCLGNVGHKPYWITLLVVCLVVFSDVGFQRTELLFDWMGLHHRYTININYILPHNTNVYLQQRNFRTLYIKS